MTWRSKKYFDFQDWVNILKLKEQGHHYSESGKELIEDILAQMNNGRLSTNINREGKVQTPLERKLLSDRIDKMLQGPSNYEDIGEGRIKIISNQKILSTGKGTIVQVLDLNDNVLHEMKSIASCAKFLGKAIYTIKARLADNKPIFL